MFLHKENSACHRKTSDKEVKAKIKTALYKHIEKETLFCSNKQLESSVLKYLILKNDFLP